MAAFPYFVPCDVKGGAGEGTTGGEPNSSVGRHNPQLVEVTLANEGVRADRQDECLGRCRVLDARGPTKREKASD